MPMATLNIKDPEVHAMAHELARLRHTSATGAVREALTEALSRARPRDTPAQRAARTLDIARRMREVDAPFLTDADLYDENGTPR